MTTEDTQHLRRAIELAHAARVAGQRPFGALLVADRTVLAEDHNTVIADRDITAHPELKLARWAAQELDGERARATTMYTSCQPCPMCAEAIRRSGIGRVVFALSAEQQRQLVRDDAGEPPVAYVGPALYDEARAAVEGHRG